MSSHYTEPITRFVVPSYRKGNNGRLVPCHKTLKKQNGNNVSHRAVLTHGHAGQLFVV